MTASRALFLLSLIASAPLLARAETCDASVFGDGVCDCGCGTSDSDCPAGTFIVCEVSHCAAGKVPWHQTPSSCMTSACGDGWKDTAGGEACDDGNALAGGGCSADCKSVTEGYACGEGAAGCHLINPDAGSAAPDAGTTEADAGDAARTPTGGCTTAPGPLPLLALVSAWLLRRRAVFASV